MSETLSKKKSIPKPSLSNGDHLARQANAMAQHVDMDPKRIEAIIDLIEAAPLGTPVVELQRLFKQSLGRVEPVEFAYAEELLLGSELMQSGQKQNLDALIHLFRPSLLQVVSPELPAGHPAESFRLEGLQLRVLLDEMRGHCARRRDDADGNREWWRQALTRLRDIDRRFRRKELLIFPMLLKKGFTRPTKIMSSLHQSLMMRLDQAARELEYGEISTFRLFVESMIQDFSQLLFKEEKVLCPTCMALFDIKDWEAIRMEEDRIGWAFIETPPEWAGETSASGLGQDFHTWAQAVQRTVNSTDNGIMDPSKNLMEIFKSIPRHVPLPLQVGNLSLDQISLVFAHLPLDVTYIDEKGVLVYHNNCFGNKHKVDPCVSKDAKPMQPSLVQCIAVHDSDGQYRGVLNISQNLDSLDHVVRESRQ